LQQRQNPEWIVEDHLTLKTKGMSANRRPSEAFRSKVSQEVAGFTRPATRPNISTERTMNASR
jgi:hypothetical protein